MEQSVLSQYARYLHGIEYISMLDDGIKRIKEVASWPDGELPEKIQSIFPVFCEYIAFNMGIKYPFFEALQFFLEGKADTLFKYISDNNYSYKTLTYTEVFEFLLLLSYDQVRTIMDLYGKLPSNSYTSVLESIQKRDYPKFSEALDNGDYTDLFCKLSLVRYILTGPDKVLLDDCFGEGKLEDYNMWLNVCDWGAYFRNYEDDDDFEMKMTDQIIRRIIGISNVASLTDLYNPGLVNSTLKKEILNDKGLFKNYKRFYDGWLDNWCVLMKDKKTFTKILDDISRREKQIVFNCQRRSNEIMEMSVYSHPREAEKYIKEKFIERKNLDDGISHEDVVVYNGIPLFITSKRPERKGRKILRFTPTEYATIVNDFLQKNDIESWKRYYQNAKYEENDFRDYVLLMSYKIAEIYNYVSGFLKNEDLELLKWIIDRSIYKDIIRGDSSLIKLSEKTLRNSCNEPIGDKYTNAIKEWRLKNYPICNFQLPNRLRDDQLEKLLEGLKKKNYIPPQSTKESLRHIFGGDHFEGYEPIIWEVKSKNNTPHKKSVLNLLVRLGIKWEKIDPQKLNYCFLTLSKDGKWVPFDNNNMKDKGKYKADSTLDGEIVDILKEVFKGDETKLFLMEKAKLVRDAQPVK